MKYPVYDLSDLKDNEVWTTADGQRIPVKYLADQHVVNIIKYMRRRSYGNDNLVIAVYPSYLNVLREASARCIMPPPGPLGPKANESPVKKSKILFR